MIEPAKFLMVLELHLLCLPLDEVVDASDKNQLDLLPVELAFADLDFYDGRLPLARTRVLLFTLGEATGLVGVFLDEYLE